MREKILELNKKFTQEEIAKQLGLTRGQINYILNGKRRDEKLKLDHRVCPITGFRH